MALSEQQILSEIDALEGNVNDEYGSSASADRGALIDRYLGNPYGTERNGFSKVVTREVYQSVENYKADIAEIFISDDETVRFEPEGVEDIEQAKQETDYVNYVFHRKNNGFQNIMDSLTDGLMVRRGVIKRYWEEQEERTAHNFDNLSALALELLEADEEVSDIEYEEDFDDLTGEYVYSGSFIRTTSTGRVVVEAIPPEEFGMSEGAKCVKDARLVRHKTKKTKSDLRQMGYSDDKLNNLGSSNGSDTTQSAEAIARSFNFSTYSNEILANESGKKGSEKEYEVTEAYIKIDADEDGVTELLKVTFVGKTLLDKEEVDEAPFEIWSPIEIPHKAEGLSIADAAVAGQEIKTVLWRNQLDNQYNLNNARPIVTENQVNMDSLSQGGPGKPVIVKTQNALRFEGPQAFPQATFAMMDKVDQMLEKDVGSSDHSIDPNILNGNTAAGAVSQVMTKRQARVRLVSRVYGEFLKRVFMGIHNLVVSYVDKKEIFRLRNNFVEVDPRTWHTRKDLSVVVGLGNGNKNEQLFHMQQVSQAQQAIIAGGGLGTLVMPNQIYNLQEDIVNIFDKTAHNRYFTDPGDITGTEGSDQPSMEDQIAMKELELKEMKLQIDAQIEKEKLALEARIHEDSNEFKLAELNLEARQERGVKVGND